MKPIDSKRAGRQLREEHDPGRYSRTSRRVWRDRRFNELSGPPPCGRYLWLYLLSNPHQTSIPGLIPLRASTIAEELGWLGEPPGGVLPEGFPPGFPGALAGPMSEVLGKGMAEADWKAGVVWLPNAVKHDPPANPNVILGWRQVVTTLLFESPLVARALAGIRQRLQMVMSKPEPYLAAFDSVFPSGFLEGLGEPSPENSLQDWGESGSRKQESGSRKQERETAAPADAGSVSAAPAQTRFALHVVAANPPDLDAEVYAHWRTLFAPRAAEVLDAERRKLIAKRRAERSKDGAGKPHDPAAVQHELLDSLSGWKNDPWADRPRNARLDQLMGNAGDIDQGLKFFADGPPKPGSAARRGRAPGGASLEEIEAQEFTVDLPPETA